MKVFKIASGGFGPHPDVREESIRIKHRFYSTDRQCEVCKSSHTVYTKSEKCIMCQRYALELVRYFADQPLDSLVEWPEHVPICHNNPTTNAEVLAMLKVLKSDDKHVLAHQPCSQYGHVQISRGGDKDCYQCNQLLKPREQAQKEHKSTYVSTSKCGGCGDITLRNTHDASCTMCEYKPSTRSIKQPKPIEETPDTVMMREAPDMIVSKVDAVAMGLKVYRTGKACKNGHTGFRYVTTGNCIDCIKS